jgi:hypothetical protein
MCPPIIVQNMWKNFTVFVAAAAVLTAAATPPSSAAQSAPTTASVLSKMTAAYGGRAVLDSIVSRIVVTDLNVRGQAARATITVKAPDKYLQRVEIPAFGIDTTVGFDGTTAWTRTAQGLVEAATGDALRNIRCQAINQNNTLTHPGGWPTTIALQKSQTVDGKSYLIIQVTPRGCDAFSVYIDPKTYLSERVVDPAQTTIFMSYARGPRGELYPKRVIAQTATAGTVIATVSSVQDNPPLADSAFTMPPPPPSPSPAPSSTPAPSASVAPAASPAVSPAPQPSPSPSG